MIKSPQNTVEKLGFGSKLQTLLLFAAAILFNSNRVTAAALTSAEPSGSFFWNLVISLIVLSATLASGALCIAAYRNWQHRGWQFAAVLPIAVLALVLILIASARLGGQNSHALWPLEIFAWSMVNLIYMVGIMTTKRIFEKADAQNEPSPKL